MQTNEVSVSPSSSGFPLHPALSLLIPQIPDLGTFCA